MTEIHSIILKNPSGKIKIVWLHGWGQSHEAMLPMANFFDDIAESILIDLPGFGKSPIPPDDWGTLEYAKAVYEKLKEQNFLPALIVGHSFGCRIAIQLAANFPESVNGLALIAAAGLKRKRPLIFRVRAFFIKTIMKLAGKLDAILKLNLKEKAAAKFGSADYRKSGELRKIFVKVVNEHLVEEAKKIKVPTLLIYGENDDQTPPETGKILNSLIEGSELTVMKNHDHYSVLSGGKPQVLTLIRSLIQRIAKEKQ